MTIQIPSIAEHKAVKDLLAVTFGTACPVLTLGFYDPEFGFCGSNPNGERDPIFQVKSMKQLEQLNQFIRNHPEEDMILERMKLISFMIEGKPSQLYMIVDKTRREANPLIRQDEMQEPALHANTRPSTTTSGWTSQPGLT